MTFNGRIHEGQIVLDGNPPLPEGADVRVEVVAPEAPRAADEAASRPSLGKVLMKYAGKASGLPPDGSRNHDHYLYGSPKK
ncbi:MAG: hypothetical protein JWN24_3407 [Phycisphaerales bacterium]|nr:hypothetical protein [Phycisphaerales bacterium]